MEGAFREVPILGPESSINVLKEFGAATGNHRLQKHGNSVDGRISRDRALEATQNGRNIMVFTIVMIIFLADVSSWQLSLPLIFSNSLTSRRDRASLGIHSQVHVQYWSGSLGVFDRKAYASAIRSEEHTSELQSR